MYQSCMIQRSLGTKGCESGEYGVDDSIVHPFQHKPTVDDEVEGKVDSGRREGKMSRVVSKHRTSCSSATAAFDSNSSPPSWRRTWAGVVFLITDEMRGD